MEGEREREGHGREACGRPYSTTWESSGLHTSEWAKNTGEHTHTRQNHANTKKGRKITSALSGQDNNQHMSAGSACSVLSTIIFVIITTERELDQDTCREGVVTAERERKKEPLCLRDDVKVHVYMLWLRDNWLSEKKKKRNRLIPQLNQMITHLRLAVSNQFDFEEQSFPAALFHVGSVS